MRQPPATGSTANPSEDRVFSVTRHAIGAVWAAMLEAKALVAASSQDNFLLKNKFQSWMTTSLVQKNLKMSILIQTIIIV